MNVRDFAALPDIGGQAARPMLLVDEPGTKRLFVNDMRGPIYSVSYDGKTVTPYVDINAPNWGVGVQSRAASAGCRASRCTRNSVSAGRPATASSTR